jgi:hypothetical protein
MRKWYRIIVALSSLLAISATAISVSLPQMAPLQHAKTVLVREFGVVLGVPCEVQAVEVTSTGSVRLSGVQLMLESAEAQAFVEVGDVSVDFSLWRLLRTHTVMQSIRAVRVHSLRVKLSGSGPDLLALMPEAQKRWQPHRPLDLFPTSSPEKRPVEALLPPLRGRGTLSSNRLDG